MSRDRDEPITVGSFA